DFAHALTPAAVTRALFAGSARRGRAHLGAAVADAHVFGPVGARVAGLSQTVGLAVAVVVDTVADLGFGRRFVFAHRGAVDAGDGARAAGAFVGAARRSDPDQVAVVVVDQAVAVVVDAVANFRTRDALRTSAGEVLVDLAVAVVVDAVTDLGARRVWFQRRARVFAVVHAALAADGPALAHAFVATDAHADAARGPAEVVCGAGVAARALAVGRATAATHVAVAAAAVSVHGA